MTADAMQAAAFHGAGRRNSALSRFLRHRLGLIGTVLIVLLVAACVFGPYLLPFKPMQIDVRGRFAPPFQSLHVFGADELGRDLLTRLLVAGRVSMAIGFAAMVVSIALGVVVGAFAGYFGRLTNTVLMRFVDAMLCFPNVFLLLTLAAFVKPSVSTITLIIALTSWMEVARLVEGQIRSLREREFTMAAILAGASNTHIIFRELVPNALGPIIVSATLTIARAILMESYISYLGYGIQPPDPSWGNMLNNSQQYLTSAPWLALFPGLFITIAVTSFNFVGDGLRDAFDPRSDQ
jgi:peptide/nickel transport system permease protein